MEKSEFLVTAMMEQRVRQLSEIIGCKSSQFPFQYLGMPLSNKKLTKSTYMPLIRKMSNKLTTWRASTLSIGGRLTLLNATLSAMPAYIMATFVLPKWVIGKLDQIRRKFLWHGHKGHIRQRYMSLTSWKLVTRTKKQGGLGVKDLMIMNRALVIKTMWKWIHVNKPSWMEIVPIRDTITRPWELNTTTTLWKNMKQLRQFFEISIEFTVGQGTHVKFWTDTWMQQPLSIRYADVYAHTVNQEATVQQMCPNGQWEIEMQTEVSPQVRQSHQLLMAELQQFQLRTDTVDMLHWKWTKERHYTVRSYYQGMSEGPEIIQNISEIWGLKAPPRVLIFTWLMLRNKILTIDNLIRRGWCIPNMCCMCRNANESVSHLFGQCQITLQITTMLRNQRLGTIHCTHFVQMNYRLAILQSQHRIIRRMQTVMCFVIRRERCRRIFTDKHKMVQLIVREIMDEFDSWFQE